MLSLFKSIIGTNGVHLVLYPQTRFAYLHLMLQRFTKNRSNLEALIQHDERDSLMESISNRKVQEFESKILSAKWLALNSLNKLLSKISIIILHIESTNSKASWVFQLMSSLIYFINDWASKASTRSCFTSETISAIEDQVIGRWFETVNRQVKINTDIILLAWILDPYTTPKLEQVPSDWEKRSLSVLSKFFATDVIKEEALVEVKKVLLRKGRWGELMKRKQQLIQPPEGKTFKSKVELSL